MSVHEIVAHGPVAGLYMTLFSQIAVYILQIPEYLQKLFSSLSELPISYTFANEGKSVLLMRE